MRQWWRYLAAGVSVYLLLLLVTLPAAHFRSTLQEQVPGLLLSGVSGSVFSGMARQGSYQGFDLGEVKWHFRPFALLLARLEYRLEVAHRDNNGQTVVGIKPGGDLYGKDLNMQLAPDRLINQFSPVSLVSHGSLRLRLDEFTASGEMLTAVTGTIEWDDAAITSPVDLVLGQLELSLQSNENNLVATVTQGGDLGVSGDISFLDGSDYSVDLVLRPGKNVSAETMGLLETVMQAGPAGSFLLETSGSL